MPTIVSRNTIRLAGTSSGTSNFYTGYVITVIRFDPVTGKESKQSKRIIGYDGAQKVATIDGIWDADFIPTSTDRYTITPKYPDNRVSINLAVMALDYITSVRYGKGLDPHKDLDLPSWLESARICDTQSDITVRVTDGMTGIVPGAVYQFTAGTMHWQGEVKSTKTGYVRFTNIIGKLTNKWNSWKTFRAGSLVYEGSVLYQVGSTSTLVTQPTHTSGSSNNLTVLTNLELTKVAGSGPATITLVVDGNPIRDVNARGVTISGYSLYDSDGIDYWRYVGWDEHDQRYVTRHQGNLLIDTSLPLFDNINSLLEHFGGILRYSSGKYALNIEEGEGEIANIPNEPRNIDSGDIIGKLRITDEGMKSSFNSLTVAYADPANKFEAKNISFFNSEFLKADRNVPKKGNVSIPGITNYYNARLLADKFLVKSRFGLTVSFNMAPKGALLLAGSVIQLQHTRYDWTNKKFRIVNLSHNTDCTVDIVAEEYDDSFYVISNVSRPPAAAKAGEAGILSDMQPGGLIASSISSEDELAGGIQLTWLNSVKAGNNVETEIYSSFNKKLFMSVTQVQNNVLVFTEPHGLEVGDTFTSHTGLNGLQVGRTYYVETKVSATAITLALVPGGPPISLSNTNYGSPFKIMSGSIIATVPSTITSYIDTINMPNIKTTEVEEVDPVEPVTPLTPEQLEDLERIQRYYWIRHKITQT